MLAGFPGGPPLQLANTCMPPAGLGTPEVATISESCRPTKLARKVAWAVATYGMTAIWEDRQWLLKGFNKLTAALRHAVVGTFGTSKGEDAVRAADVPPAQPTLDRRREQLPALVIMAPEETPKKLLLPVP